MSSMIQNKDGRFEFFAVDKNADLMHKWTDLTGSWSEWHRLSGGWREITVARNGDGRLEVCGIGTDNKLWHQWQQSP